MAQVGASLLVLRHVPFEGVGRMRAYWASRGVRLEEWVATDGKPLPPLEKRMGLVVMGGPMGADDEARYAWMAGEKRLIESALKREIPVLGFCLGAQLLARVLGASVRPMGYREIGWWPVQRADSMLTLSALKTFPDSFTAFHWHGDAFALPAGATRLFRSEACAEQGFAYGEKAWGFQFHPEIGPEEAHSLVEACGHEVREGGFWVASAEALTAPNPEWLIDMDRALAGFLDGWLPHSGNAHPSPPTG